LLEEMERYFRSDGNNYSYFRLGLAVVKRPVSFLVWKYLSSLLFLLLSS